MFITWSCSREKRFVRCEGLALANDNSYRPKENLALLTVKKPMSLSGFDRIPSTAELVQLSTRIVTSWKFLARRLEVAQSEIHDVSASNSNVREQAHRMLQTWVEKNGQAATVRRLVRALSKEGMIRTVEEVFGARIYSQVVHGTIYKQNNIDEDIYQKALAFGSVPVNRYRVMVVGQDGAGKSCLIDSFLGRRFKKKNPSTDGIAIHVAVTAAVTAAEGKEGQHTSCADPPLTWTEENDKAQHLKDLLAAGYRIKKDQESNPTEAVSRAKRPRRLEPGEHTTEFDIKKLADSKYLKSDEALEDLKECEVNQKLLWDLGGQEMYLASHAALMPAESDYTLCMYLLVIDINKDLDAEAKSSLRSGKASSSDVPLKSLSMKYNKDFLCHWFTSIGICHPSDKSSELYLGEDLGVRYPAILIVATHIDKVNSEDSFESQNTKLEELISNLRCQAHIFKNPENKQWFFRVDNTKSGEEAEKRCKGVEKIMSILDDSSKHYWSQKNKERPMPVKWVCFEMSLVMRKEEKIISKETAIEIFLQIDSEESEEEAVLALKFIHNLGAIFYFSDVSELAKHVIVNPQWLIDTVAGFVTAKELPLSKALWDELCKTGEMSIDGISGILKQENVKEKDRNLVIDVLKMLDILCYLDPNTVLIPCMVTNKLKETPVWAEYSPSPSQGSPPPIVIFPKKVQIIPEALFFRIVTKCARKYPKLASKLTRNRGIFWIDNNLKLELFYYDRGTSLIVSMTGKKDMENASSSVSNLAFEIRQFVTEAKERGMSGLNLAFYCQVTKCGFESDVDTGKISYQLPCKDCLVELPDWGSTSQFFKMKKDHAEEKRKLVDRWYRKENISSSESQAPHRELLQEEIQEKHLTAVYLKIETFWKLVARELGVPEYVIDSCQRSHSTDEERCHAMLQKWKTRQRGKGKVWDLASAIYKAKLEEVVEEVYGESVLKALHSGN